MEVLKGSWVSCRHGAKVRSEVTTDEAGRRIGRAQKPKKTMKEVEKNGKEIRRRGKLSRCTKGNHIDLEQ